MKLDSTRPPDSPHPAAAGRDRTGTHALVAQRAEIRHLFASSGAIVAGLLVLAGCAPYITAANGDRMRANSQEFRGYARQVFEMQNETVTRIAYALDDLESDPDQIDRYNSIVDADDRMMDACAELNKLAIARRDDKQLGMSELAGVASSVPDCERATAQATRLISNVSPDPDITLQ